MFISFEGTEGCGKSTHCKALARYLRRKGHRVKLIREPGSTKLGDAIRKILLSGPFKISAETETLLYMASRAELVRQVILPALRRKEVVISDRWVDATLAYQGYGSGVDLKWIRQTATVATASLVPDITFFLDVPVETGLRRAAKRGRLDRIEKRALDFHRRVHRGYRQLAESEKRFHRIVVGAFESTRDRIRKVIDRVV